MVETEKGLLNNYVFCAWECYPDMSLGEVKLMIAKKAHDQFCGRLPMDDAMLRVAKDLCGANDVPWHQQVADIIEDIIKIYPTQTYSEVYEIIERSAKEQRQIHKIPHSCAMLKEAIKLRKAAYQDYTLPPHNWKETVLRELNYKLNRESDPERKEQLSNEIKLWEEAKL
jgi:hypothetical protein